MSEPRLVALDIALDHSGLVRTDGWSFSSKGGKGDFRLHRLYLDVLKLAKDADLAIIEDLPMSARNGGLTGMAAGVARMALAENDVPVVKVVASTLKLYATGSGRAEKPAMVAAANVLKAGQGLAHYPEITDHNQADAFCLWHLGKSWLRKGGRARAANVKWDAWTERLKELGYE